jgi:hypothetical protein
VNREILDWQPNFFYAKDTLALSPIGAYTTGFKSLIQRVESGFSSGTFAGARWIALGTIPDSGGFTAAPWLPEDNGMIGANFDPALAFTTGVAFASAVIALLRVKVPAGKAITNILTYSAVAGAGLTAGTGNLAGIYESSGVQSGVSGDIRVSHWQAATSLLTIPLGTPVPASKVGRKVYVAMMATGTTPPTIVVAGTNNAREGLTANANIAATGALQNAGVITGQTTLPSSLTLTTMTQGYKFWVGLT